MSYTSQGTISMQCKINDEGAVTETTIFFVPGNDYSIEHRNETWAVFVSESADAGIIKKCEPGTGNGVKLSAGKDFPGLISSVVVQQTKVEVHVKETDLKIAGITVPAK